MRRPALIAIAAFALLTLAACSSGGGGTTAPATPAAASEPAGSPAAEGGCAVSTETASVSISIADFAFDPADAQAKVGDVVGWANSDAAPHTATLDDGSCATGNIPASGSGALVFNTAGTFAYHCAIHPTMTASITITE